MGMFRAGVRHVKALCRVGLLWVCKLTYCMLVCPSLPWVQVVQTSSSLRVVAVSQSSLPVAGARKLLATISGMTCPKAPPSLSCNLNLGTFPVEGLDSKVQFLVVQDQDSMTLDAWQGLAGPLDSDEGLAGATADPEGSRSPPGSARAAGRGGSGSEGEGGEVELEAAPLLLQLPPAAAVQPQQQQQPRPQPHSPAAAFGVVTPVGGVTPTGSPRAVAAAASSSSGFAGVSSLLPRATAAWVSGGSSGSPQRPSTPSSAHHAATTAAAASNGASSSKSAGGGRCPSYVCPCLVFVVEQQECTGCMVQTPLLFEELDTLNLSGLGIGDEGAAGMAKTLTQNPNMRRCVLSDNKIGAEGGAALAASLAINTNLQVMVPCQRHAHRATSSMLCSMRLSCATSAFSFFDRLLLVLLLLLLHMCHHQSVM